MNKETNNNLTNKQGPTSKPNKAWGIFRLDTYSICPDSIRFCSILALCPDIVPPTAPSNTSSASPVAAARRRQRARRLSFVQSMGLAPRPRLLGPATRPPVSARSLERLEGPNRRSPGWCQTRHMWGVAGREGAQRCMAGGIAALAIPLMIYDDLFVWLKFRCSSKILIFFVAPVVTKGGSDPKNQQIICLQCQLFFVSIILARYIHHIHHHVTSHQPLACLAWFVCSFLWQLVA